MREIHATHWTIAVFFTEMQQYLRPVQAFSRDVDAQVAHVTTWFEELLQVVMTAIVKSESVDLKQFPQSSEYAALKALFAASFLGNQLEAFKVRINRPNGREKKWRFSKVGRIMGV